MTEEVMNQFTTLRIIVRNHLNQIVDVIEEQLHEYAEDKWVADNDENYREIIAHIGRCHDLLDQLDPEKHNEE